MQSTAYCTRSVIFMILGKGADRYIIQMMRVMRLTAFLLTSFCLQVSAHTWSQTITYSGQNVSLEKIFDEVRRQTNFFVTYDPAMLEGTQPVTVDLDNVPVNDFLEIILANQPLTYTIKKTTIFIQQKQIAFVPTPEIQQLPPVTGVIRGPDGQPLAGVNITVKGAKKGTASSLNGHFSIEAKEGDVLIFTSIGYVKKEITVGVYLEIGTISLVLSDSKLDEVQIIAYGTTSQRLNTGNVTTIKSDVIEKQPVNNPLLALSGRVPGLFIEQATGFAGTGIKVRIQGENSLNNGNNPLYVIDGVPYSSQLLPDGNGVVKGSGVGVYEQGTNPLNFINPDDIESISVLKDAGATAIYGSRAANGAILITTRKGRSGASRVNINIQNGWSKVFEKLDMMNTRQYLEYRREALKNDGRVLPNPGPFGDSDLNGNWDTTRNTDWQKELIGGTAKYQDIQASVSGGNNLTTFLIGAGYHKETNVFPGDYADTKASVHFNITNTSANQKFKIQLSGNYLNDDNTLPNIDLTSSALQLAPLAPALFNSEGGVNWAPDASGTSTFYRNPIGYLYDSYRGKTNNLTSNAVISYQIMPGLDIKTSFGYTSLLGNSIQKSHLEAIDPESRPYTTRGTIFVNNKINSWVIEPQLTFNRNIGRGNLDLLLATSIQQNNSNSLGVIASGFSNDLVMEDILSASRVSAGQSLNYKYKYNALFGRATYNITNKYIFDLSARRDGSTRFGPANQFHDFAAVAAAWIFSQEKLFKNNLPFLSFGKLRASYGTTGNDQIADYQFLSLYNPQLQQVPYQGVVTYQPTRLANPFLQWEETRKLNAALELGFFNDRILLNANYFRNRSSNQLSRYDLPYTTGFADITKNRECTIQNSGWELTLSGTTVKSGDFSMITSVNITVPRNKLIDYPNLQSTSDRYRLIIGKSINIVKAYHFAGVDPATGLYQFADKNGNPTLYPNDPDDKTAIVDQFPKFYGGFQNTFNYKSFQLDILFQFSKQKGQNIAFGLYSIPGLYAYGNGNQPVSILERWQKTGDVKPVQRYYSSGYDIENTYWHASAESDAAWADASYIRLKNISLSWQLPVKWQKSVHLQNCSLFVHGQNLLTITHYVGLDPETKSSTSLPVLRVISAGAKITL